MSRPIKAFSLVEMLITITIISVVMLLTSITLTTLIKASAQSAIKTVLREESEFALELMRRTVRNSHTEDILVFDVSERVYNEETGLVEATNELISYSSPVGEGVLGSEIHFRPSGFQRWVCIGYFHVKDDPTSGYILKSSAADLNGRHEACFDSEEQEYAQNTIIINSSEVDVDSMTVEYFSTRGQNMLMTVDIQMESENFLPGSAGSVKPVINRQAIISTQKLTWE